MPRINATNDFVVRFANVNGSGSATANEMFARAVMRHGVPVASRNIFPSNIQGLPTWYEVRVNEEGWRGRRGGADFVVAVNPQTFAKDIASIDKGGYLLYDSTRAIPAAQFREDINVLGVPFTRLCNEANFDPRKRLILKNIIYVGVMVYLFGMDLEVTENLIRDQLRSKPKLQAPNIAAITAGYEYAREYLKDACGLKIRKSDKIGDKIFLSGNNAAGLGCVWGGATVCAWYPITPSTSLVESFIEHSEHYRKDSVTGKKAVAVVQAEDELASIGMVLGAGWNGSRAFTATSGPGLSLMQEFLSFAYFAEIPSVLFDVQRGGPSTGMPTRTQQSDILNAAYAGHGDTKQVMLLPQDPCESFCMAAGAFDLAEQLQTPILVMSDLDIGMNEWLCKPLSWNPERRYQRGKVMRAVDLEAIQDFGRYRDVDGDGIPYRTLPGTHPSLGAFFTRGTSHDAYARYSEEGAVYVDGVQRLLRKFETAKKMVPAPEIRKAKKKTSYGIIYYGSTAAAMDEALAALADHKVWLDALRIRAFPFADEIEAFADSHETVFLVEQNRDAQMKKLLICETGIDPKKLVSLLHYDGTPITERFITREIIDHISPAAKEAAE